jgi:hypothetical protein
MPLYDFKCEVCEHVETLSMSIATKEKAEEECSLRCSECNEHLVQVHLTADHAFMSPEGLGRKKAPEDWRNFLSAIKRAHPDGFIRDH